MAEIEKVLEKPAVAHKLVCDLLRASQDAFIKIASMNEETFDKFIEEHKDGEIAKILIESGANLRPQRKEEGDANGYLERCISDEGPGAKTPISGPSDC
jgi:hypothetical protein